MRIDRWTRPRRLAVLAGVLGVIGAGCEHGARDRPEVRTAQDAAEDQRVLVVVHDQRSEVIDGTRAPEFVGLIEDDVGEVTVVETASGEELAWEATDELATELEARGLRAQRLRVSHQSSPEQVLEQARAQGVDRILLVTIHDWSLEQRSPQELRSDMEATVFDRDGNVISRMRVRDINVLPSNFDRSSRQFSQTDRPLLRDRLLQLLDDEATQRALSLPSPPSGTVIPDSEPPSPPDTVAPDSEQPSPPSGTVGSGMASDHAALSSCLITSSTLTV